MLGAPKGSGCPPTRESMEKTCHEVYMQPTKWRRMKVSPIGYRLFVPPTNSHAETQSPGCWHLEVIKPQGWSPRDPRRALDRIFTAMAGHSK